MAGPSIFERWRKQDADKGKDDRTRYRELLTADNLTDKQVGELREIAGRLGRSVETVEADQETLRAAGRLAAAIAANPDNPAKREKAGKAMRDHKAETDKIVRKRNRKEAELTGEFYRLADDARRRDQDRDNLAKLKAKHAAIFPPDVIADLKAERPDLFPLTPEEIAERERQREADKAAALQAQREARAKADADRIAANREAGLRDDGQAPRTGQVGGVVSSGPR